MTIIAYHIIWTTYGTFLPGDARGWVSKHAAGIRAPDPGLEQQSRRRMAEPAVVLMDSQRTFVEQTIREHCRIRKWSLHALNVRSNHVHVLVSSDLDGKEVMKQFKAWCSRRLSDAVGLKDTIAVGAGRRRWFGEGGIAMVVEDEAYFHNAIHYVSEGQ